MHGGLPEVGERTGYKLLLSAVSVCRFYDETGSLGSSGTRYCFTTAPAFTYSTNIKVLFKTNNDANTGKGKVIMELTNALLYFLPESRI